MSYGLTELIRTICPKVGLSWELKFLEATRSRNPLNYGIIIDLMDPLLEWNIENVNHGSHVSLADKKMAHNYDTSKLTDVMRPGSCTKKLYGFVITAIFQ